MKTEITAAMVALMLVGIASLAAADDHWDEDRELTYAGTTRQDHDLNEACDEALGKCLTHIPRGMIYTTCDDSDGIQGSGINGIGGGIFCGIRLGTTITVTLHDELLQAPEAIVTCPYVDEVIYPPSGSPWPPLIGVTWHKELGRAAPSLTLDVPDDCIEIVENEGGLTDIGIFIYTGTATTGTVALEHEPSKT